MFNKLFIISVISLFLSACATNSSTVITEKNAQILCSPLPLKENETFIIKLPSSRFSGYEWKLENKEDSILKLLNHGTKHDEDSKSRIHREETFWEYKAIHPGKTTLSFTYQLAWDNNVQNSQRVECSVTVSNK